MNERLLDLSGKIDAFRVELFSTVARVAHSVNVPFFVVGATARDILLTYGYGIKTARATNDIDLGVEVSGWDRYDQLRKALLGTGDFAVAREPQRLMFRETLWIDVIPFGAITGEDHSLSFPPDHRTQMSTLGFEESYRSSQTVRLKSDPDLDIEFVSLPGLAVLKIVAWNENYLLRKKDAQDLCLIIQNYLDAGNRERLFDEESDLFDEEAFDYVLAGARLLGRDIARILGDRTREAVLAIMDRETGEQDRYRLIEDVMSRTDDFDEKLQLIEALKSGILDMPYSPAGNPNHVQL